MRRHDKRLGDSRPDGKRPGAKALSAAAVAGIAVVAVAWWIGPSLFGATSTAPELRVVEATVLAPARCTTPGAEETVRFELAGEVRKGTLTACGHDPDERVKVAVPMETGSGPVDVRSATSSPGYSALRGPLGLLLLALSCSAGCGYAYLVIRGPRRRPAMA